MPIMRKLRFLIPSTSSKSRPKVNSFLSAVQPIVEDILSKRTDLTREEVLALIEQKKKEGRVYSPTKVQLGLSRKNF